MHFYAKGTDLKIEHLMRCFTSKWQIFMHDSTFEWLNKTINNTLEQVWRFLVLLFQLDSTDVLYFLYKMISLDAPDWFYIMRDIVRLYRSLMLYFVTSRIGAKNSFKALHGFGNKRIWYSSKMKNIFV